MKLGALKIMNVAVSDMLSVNVEQLGGREPFIVAGKVPTNYKNISSIENFHKYGRGLVGSFEGFRDWKCLQREIKALVLEKVSDDLSANWKNLSKEEKKICCFYLLSRVPEKLFHQTFPDSEERSKIISEFDLNNRRARGGVSAMTGRFQAVRQQLFAKLDRDAALEVLSIMSEHRLPDLYENGIEGTEEDGRTGILDYILARKKTPFTTTGLKKKKYKMTDDSGDIKELADHLAQIIVNGNY